jgi:glycosyltransferase involved in cell wall biosynthesis
MRICYFGTYREAYSRNRILIEGLRLAGAEVVECHAPLWTGIEDRVAAVQGQWASAGFLRRVAAAYRRLLARYKAIGAYDILCMGYPGVFDSFLGRGLAQWRGKPCTVDMFMSIYLIAVERGLHQNRPGQWTVQGLKLAERLACRLPHALIGDTRQYAQWYARTHRIPAERFVLAPTGANSQLFKRQPARPPRQSMRVLYYGTYIPNHGVPYILEAARALSAEPDIEFVLVGDGPDRAAAQALTEQYGLARVSFQPWLEPPQLLQQIAEADVCLGAFGQTPQSRMTVHNKVYEALAAGRPVVTGDSEAVRDALVVDEQVCVVDRADPHSLAETLRRLLADPAWRQRLAEAGHAIYCERYTPQAIGRQLLTALERLSSGA